MEKEWDVASLRPQFSRNGNEPARFSCSYTEQDLWGDGTMLHHGAKSRVKL